MEEQRKYRVAVIGCGVISGTHIPLLKKEESVEIVALCDIDTDAAEKARKVHQLHVPIYRDYVEMLDREPLDAVHILTPHYLHAPMTLAAIERGVHVCLEKPLAITEEDATAIIKAAEERQVKVCVCYQNRMNPQVISAKKIIEEDGGVRAAYGAVIWNRDEAYYKSGSWRGKMETEGGGVLINQAIHTIDLLCFFIGKPMFLCGNTANHHLKGVIDVEDSAMATVTFDSGTVANLYATTAHGGKDEIEIFLRTENHTVRILATDLLVDDKPICLEQQKALGHKACYGAGHGTLIPAFYRALRENAPSPIDAGAAMDSLKILLGVYRSHGERITL